MWQGVKGGGYSVRAVRVAAFASNQRFLLLFCSLSTNTKFIEFSAPLLLPILLAQ